MLVVEMFRTFSWVSARLVVVAKNPDQSQRKLRKVLTGSSMTSASSGDISSGEAAVSGGGCGAGSRGEQPFSLAGSSSSGVAGSCGSTEAG